MLTRDQVVEKFRGNLHCSQVVLGELCEDLGYDQEEGYRMSCPFGGGMRQGDTCGCVIGALMALGMAFGNSEAGNKAQDELCQEKSLAFQTAFKEKYGSTICRELIGYDFRDPAQRQACMEAGKTREFCPDLVLGAIDIARSLLEDA